MKCTVTDMSLKQPWSWDRYVWEATYCLSKKVKDKRIVHLKQKVEVLGIYLTCQRASDSPKLAELRLSEDSEASTTHSQHQPYTTTAPYPATPSGAVGYKLQHFLTDRRCQYGARDFKTDSSLWQAQEPQALYDLNVRRLQEKSLEGKPQLWLMSRF